MLLEDSLDVHHRAHDAVEADPCQAYLGLGLPAFVGDHYHWLSRPDHVPGVLGEAAIEADVDRSGQVAGREGLWGSPVDHDGAVSNTTLHLV